MITEAMAMFVWLKRKWKKTSKHKSIRERIDELEGKSIYNFRVQQE